MNQRENVIILHTDDNVPEVWNQMKDSHIAYGVVLTDTGTPVGLVYAKDTRTKAGTGLCRIGFLQLCRAILI